MDRRSFDNRTNHDRRFSSRHYYDDDYDRSHRDDESRRRRGGGHYDDEAPPPPRYDSYSPPYSPPLPNHRHRQGEEEEGNRQQQRRGSRQQSRRSSNKRRRRRTNNKRSSSSRRSGGGGGSGSGDESWQTPSSSSSSFSDRDEEDHRGRKRRRRGRSSRRQERERRPRSSDEDDDNQQRGSRRHRRRRSRRRRSPPPPRHERSRSPSPSVSPPRRDRRHHRRTVVSDDDEDHNNNNNKRVQQPQLEPATKELRNSAAAAATTTNNDGPRSASHNNNKQQQRQQQRDDDPTQDDNVGHFLGGNGAIVADRYKVLREVGLGTFGRVVECLDMQERRPHHNRFVALKIVRKIKRYHESALIEAQIVQNVNRRGGRGSSHCVVLYDSFSFDGHYCMVFESLGPSLYDFLKKHDYRAFPMVCVQDFTVQLLEALEFLHSFRLVHTDLKIENILLMNDREVSYRQQRVPESTRIKLIDFGGACYDRDKKSSVINTRQYRAPEVILGAPSWSMPSDMWSLGCILLELYQGELLFATHDSVEHLALIERVVGPFPRRMVKLAKTNGTQIDLANQSFDSDGRHRLGRVLSSGSASFVRNSPRLEHLVRAPEDVWFLDLLRMIFVIDPEERATAHECLQFLSRIRRDEVHCK